MSNELKATPGPYGTEKPFTGSTRNIDSYNAVRVYSHDPGPENDFTIGYAVDVDEPTRKANAHLLAASWELYHALEAVVEDSGLQELIAAIGEEPPFISTAVAALAKARGEL